MPIWIGDWLNNRKPLDDGYVLYHGGLDASYDDIYAAPLIEQPCADGPNEVCIAWGEEVRYTGDVPLPPEHPDDIAIDARLREALFR